MDILELSNLGEKFDLIECCGVLHHMQKPSEGLKSLISVLETDGFLKLGLYSELARKEIVEARKKISSCTSSVDYQEEIFKFRKKIINGEIPEIKDLNFWPDFYSTSMFRDLCLHVMEHRYSIKQIKELLIKFDLEFLGFVLPHGSKEKYSSQFPDDICQIDLSNWSKFEYLYQDTFRAMYQFWVKLKLD